MIKQIKKHLFTWLMLLTWCSAMFLQWGTSIITLTIATMGFILTAVGTSKYADSAKEEVSKYE